MKFSFSSFKPSLYLMVCYSSLFAAIIPHGGRPLANRVLVKLCPIITFITSLPQLLLSPPPFLGCQPGTGPNRNSGTSRLLVRKPVTPCRIRMRFRVGCIERRKTVIQGVLLYVLKRLFDNFPLRSQQSLIRGRERLFGLSQRSFIHQREID